MVHINSYLVNDTTAPSKALMPISVSDKVFQEEWLQELLFKHLSILIMGFKVNLKEKLPNDINLSPAL
jgi:hypothetical protein